MLNILGFDNNSKYFKIYFCKRKKGSATDFEEKQLVFDGNPQWADGPIFSNTKAVKKSFKFNVGEFDDGYLRFEYERNNPNKWGGLFMTELDLYEGSSDRLWQPCPDDNTEPIEAVRTQVTQLAGSWAVRNLNSNGDVLNSINLLANGTNRIDGRLTHITGQTKIDNAVIKDGMIASLNADKVTGGTIDANRVNVINVNVKSLVGDLSEFSKTLWKSYYSNMKATGEGLLFTGAVGNFLEISNGWGILTIGSGDKSVDFTPYEGGGLGISMDYDGYFRLGYGKDRDTDVPLIEASNNFVKIGTERNYIRFSTRGVSVTVNGYTKDL